MSRARPRKRKDVMVGPASTGRSKPAKGLDDGHLLDAAQQFGNAVEHLMGAPLKFPIGSDFS